ncbi:hypothetical protein V2J09_017476 [Rumex salicifolius]
MSAKILYSLSSDDNPKQLGCINGFLQHFLSGRVVNGHGDHHHHHHQKRLLLQGQAKVESKDGKEVTNKGKKSPKNNNKEITSKMSTESSSMASSSSSSTSSTLSPSQDFASINSHQLSLKSSREKHIISNVMVHIDSPRPLQPSNHQNQKLSTSTNTPPRTHKHSSSVDLKEKKKPHARRLSYDGRESERSNLKLAELPRLSLDSRQGRMRSASASATASEFRSEFLQEEPVSNRAVSSIVAKLMGLDDLPSSTPKSNRSRKSEELDLVSRSTRSTDESDTESDRHSVSIYKEIDKRLGDLDFKKSSKDLRALKHILEAMQRTKPKTENRPEENIQETCIKRSPYEEHKGIKNQETLPRVRTRRATNAKPSVVEKRRAKDLSPKIKTSQKCDKLEKFSHERRARSVVNVITSSPTKQNTKSSRKNMESRTKKVVDQCDMVHTPPPSQKPKKSMNDESMVIVKEQPSPVSVLDADFYDDESLSPINKKATTFRDDDDSPVLAKPEWISEMDTNHFSNNTRSSLSSSNKEKTNDFRYKDNENDFLTSIIAKDLAKSWTDFSSENSWLVLDIERLIFKDLIVELLHG